MKISILIPSRNRPRLLSAVITALHEMESGENEIIYCIGVDEDDWATRKVGAMFLQADGITSAIKSKLNFYIIDGSILTIGGIWNYLAKFAEADIYSCLIDDAFPISPHWDKAMVDTAKTHPAFSWYETSAPSNPGYPTVTKDWLKSVGYISEDHYPYWFFDSAFAELVNFITNEGVPMCAGMSLFSKQEETQNLRELSFWWSFFFSTRIIRLKEAHKTSKSELGFDDFMASRKKWIDAGITRDLSFRGQRINEIENARKSDKPPSEKYLKAKSNAEKYLADNGLVPWQFVQSS
jgi:hypothetical protein